MSSDNTMQAKVHEAGLQAAAAVHGQEAPTASPAVDKALDPNSDFPEKPIGSKEQQEATRQFLGPEGAHQDLKNVEQMKVVPPVAGKSGQGDLKGDMVGGINRGVGASLASDLGDTQGGKKGTGGVDISNAAGMGGV